MRAPPKLTTVQITQVLQEQFGVAATALAFLSLGNDSATSAYFVQAPAVQDIAAYGVRVDIVRGSWRRDA